MAWIPVKEKLPDKYTNCLITVKDKKMHKNFVIPCEWSYVIDLDTAEIVGEPSFVAMVSIEGKDTYIDYRQDDSIKILAWMPYPQPYDDGFRVIVAGSRTFTDYGFLKKTLDKAFEKHKPTSIVCGEAKGADLLGRRYAEEHGIKVDSYPADWTKNGKAAGYIRNEQMADAADACICFIKNNSAGSTHMAETARKKGLQVRVINCGD